MNYIELDRPKPCYRVCSRLSEGEAYVGEIKESLNWAYEENYSTSSISTFIGELESEEIVIQSREGSKNRKYYKLNWNRFSDIFLERFLKINSPRHTKNLYVNMDLKDDDNFREFAEEVEKIRNKTPDVEDDLTCFWIAELAVAGEDRYGLKPYIEECCKNYLRTNLEGTLNEMFQDIEKSSDAVLFSTNSFGEKNPQNIIATLVSHTKSPVHTRAFGIEERSGLTPFMASLLAYGDSESILEMLEQKYGEVQKNVRDEMRDMIRKFKKDGIE